MTTTPNPSRSVSPEPTKGVEDARELVWIAAGFINGSTIERELAAFESAIRSAYIPLVEAALAHNEDLLGYEMSGEESLDRERAFMLALKPFRAALVQVPGQQQADTEQGGG